MRIGGFQKLTLLDYPEKTACIIFTSGCNFRCPWCHNSALARENSAAVSETEVLDYLKKRRGMLDGVCISGGEPLLQEDLPDFIREIKNFGYAVKLDTNGSFPEALEQLVQNGLVDYAAMDIKNTFRRYAETIGLPEFPEKQIRRSISLLKKNCVDYEFRVTLTQELYGTVEIEELARSLAGGKHLFLQPFRDSPGVLNHAYTGPDSQTLKIYRDIARQYLPTEIRA